MLKIEHISKTFNPGTVNEKQAIRDLSLNLEKGDFATIIGSNGNAGAVYLLYVGCFTRYEIAENRRFCGRDCDVCYVAPVCGDGGNRACNY